MLEISVFLIVIGYLSWRFFFKPLKRRHKRYKSSDYKKAFKWHNKRDFKNKQKGDKYERQIGKEYQNNGYKVYFKGLKEGKSDNGIDLVAYKGDEAVLIQCKNWERTQVKQEQLRIFLGDCTSYIEKKINACLPTKLFAECL
ncbi:restriction endonuclease [Helicobacter sp. T3_23-1056]